MKPQPPNSVSEPDLQRENSLLHDQLHRLHLDARHNQKVMLRSRERELALLSAGDLVELLERLTTGMRSSFGVDGIRLLLLDPDSVIRGLLEAQTSADTGLMRNIELCTDISTVRGRIDGLDAPWLGRWNDRQHRALFGCSLAGSVALLPLRRTDGPVGLLCLGSRDRQRFQAGQATDFLGHLASVAAVCLENAVNREKLHLTGLTDSLTGLYNRRHLQHRLEQEVTRAQRYGQPLSCLFVDADHFKRINDAHGHASGDLVLNTLAQRLRTRLRSSDLPTRYGGEEFAVLLPQTDARNAHSLAQHICVGIAAEPVTLETGEQIKITVSIGVAAMAEGDERSPRETGRALLQAADDAVYRAKEAGRNCVVTAADGC
jgi:diguanylate cyclase (GGDEF)-like protein